MFDKEKEFEFIEEKLNEIRIACNRLGIPFIWVAAIKDDGTSTEYKVAIDENETPDLDVVKYPCHALVPGSMGIKLADDKIRDIIKVLNGFKVVANTSIPYNPEEFSYSALFPQKNDLYEVDQTEGAIYVRMDDAGDAPKKEKGQAEEESIVLGLDASNVLPRIDDDFQ